jgi:hypothetical protein
MCDVDVSLVLMSILQGEILPWLAHADVHETMIDVV